MTNPVASLFDLVAADYDQTGVAFFGPIADRLVTALDPQPGERCLDVGSGRGAVTRRLVERVGPHGDVLGVDLSAEMVRRATAEVPGARFEVGDAAAPGPADGGWDVVAGGLVLFFLRDPVGALAAWRERLRSLVAARLAGWAGLTRPGLGGQPHIFAELDLSTDG
jgi:ubiquinone/menaquinone biosynthesis C-methylase UbiE